MKIFAYPALIERDGDYLVISFRDIPEALGQIAVADESTLADEARETLMIALRYYFEEGRFVRTSSEPLEGEMIIELPPDFVAEIMAHNALCVCGYYGHHCRVGRRNTACRCIT